MAELYEATLTPDKDELIGPWLRTRPWWDGAGDRDPVEAFRLDDPAGEVGIQCFLFGSSSGSTLFVPVTYRASPLPGGEPGLIGTMEHSVLGPRWVYDACVDPVFVATVLATIRDGGREAEQTLHRADGTVEHRELTTRARGEGVATVVVPDPDDPVTAVDTDSRTEVRTGSVTLNVTRRVGADLPPGPSLVCDYAGGTGVVLATVG